MIYFLYVGVLMIQTDSYTKVFTQLDTYPIYCLDNRLCIIICTSDHVMEKEIVYLYVIIVLYIIRVKLWY